MERLREKKITRRVISAYNLAPFPGFDILNTSVREKKQNVIDKTTYDELLGFTGDLLLKDDNEIRHKT